MTHYVHVARADQSVAEAVRLMLQVHISGLPVVNSERKVVGMVTEGDFLRRVETGTVRRRPRWLEFLLGPGRLAQEYVATHARQVFDVMTRDVVTISADTPLNEIVELMERYAIKRLPVVLGDGKLIGIVSRADLLRAFASVEATRHVSEKDVSIRKHIIAAMQREPWGPAASVNVVVHDGIVDLWGTILDEREREALRVVAENSPGVKQVRDHVNWIEPMSGMAFAAPDAPEAQPISQAPS